MSKEIWKDVVGYEGLYQVSNLGNVYSNITNKLRALTDDKYGYKIISLSLNKKLRMSFVHRLVGIAFIPNPENKTDINHINGIKHDNRLYNLEWATRSENMIHSIKIGLYIPISGESHFNSKLTKAIVLDIRRKYATGDYIYKELAKEYNISQGHISDIVNKKWWK